MDSDLSLVLGLVIAALAIPSVISAFTDGRAPRASAVTILIAGALVVYAITTHPGGYALADVPTAVMQVYARFKP